MTRTRIIVGAVLLLAVMAGAWFWRSPAPELAQHDSLVVERPRVDSVIREHGDSARERVRLVYVGQDEAKRLALVAQQASQRADSLAQIASDAAGWHRAYDTLRVAYDSLGTALGRERKATEDALAGGAFWQLAYLADSTELHRTRADADRLATALKAQAPGWTDGITVGCGVGLRGTDCYVGVGVPVIRLVRKALFRR